jgi:cytidylate kinase
VFRVLTVAREYGSGGGRIARNIAQRLEWNLLDKARSKQSRDPLKWIPNSPLRYDERVDSWVHRISRRSLWHGAFEGVATVTDTDFFDAETMALRAQDLIREAHARGNCVIVGRGGQCALQNRPNVLHVSVYAPLSERITRGRGRFADGPNDPGGFRLGGRLPGGRP